MAASGSQFVLRDAIFDDCHSNLGNYYRGSNSIGGGLAFYGRDYGSVVFVERSIFTNNSAHSGGGAAFSLQGTDNFFFIHDSLFAANGINPFIDGYLTHGGGLLVDSWGSAGISGAITDTSFIGNVGSISAAAFEWVSIRPSEPFLFEGVIVAGNLSANAFTDSFSGSILWSGGGSSSGSILGVRDSTFSGNRGVLPDEGFSAGVLLGLLGGVVVEDSSFSGNDGFGLALLSAASSGYRPVRVERSSFVNNGGFGLMVSDFDSVLLSNSTVGDNDLTSPGPVHGPHELGLAALLVANESVLVEHSTISGNVGGLVAYSNNSQAHISNSIVSGNHHQGDGPADVSWPDFAGVATSHYSIVGTIGPPSPVLWLGATDSELHNPEATTVFSERPLLHSPSGNGGATLTMLPFADSPALNSGDPTFTIPPLYDQRGPGFPRAVGGRINIGAVEGFSGYTDKLFHSRFK